MMTSRMWMRWRNGRLRRNTENDEFGGPDRRDADDDDKGSRIDINLRRRAIAANEEGVLRTRARKGAGFPEIPEKVFDGPRDGYRCRTTVGLQHGPLNAANDRLLDKD